MLWTRNKNIDNVVLLGVAREIIKKRMNRGMALVQSSVKSQNAILPFQGSWGQ